ncbi:MAG TPA: hypothetical protein VGB97_02110 [Candidatus Paceibacterota bacterium]
MKTTTKIALLSASTKDSSLVAFAQGLIDLDWSLLASSGTKTFLEKHDIPSRDVADIVGAPILGHRVVTLSREIHAGILARLDNPDDMAELERLGIEPISLVYVNFYPLLEELNKDDCTLRSVIEAIDIGGPTLLRAAAKSGRIVVSNPNQFEAVLEAIRSGEHEHFRMELAASSELAVQHYCRATQQFYGSVVDGEFLKKFE